MLSLHPVTPPQATEVPSPPADSVPRWCVQRYPCVGTDAIRLFGYDGNGYVLYEYTMPLKEGFDGELEQEERRMERKLEIRRAKLESRPPVLLGFGPRLVR